jgi:formate hydrogenlyase subunit 3/multisubunit Na+/H+ antiporter MnhD subunit
MSASFRLDALAAWFVLALNLVGASAALYAVAYGRHLAEPRRALPFLAPFLAAMNLVVLADDAFTFLFGWGAMSATSWLLVLANHREAETARAALVYAVMATLGALCLLVAFALIAGAADSLRFAAWRRAGPLDGWLQVAALGLALAGFAAKAGLAPLHVWLPMAHAAAPSHVSALMSGAMTKVAIYGLARLMLDLGGEIGWGWGAVLMALGAGSAVLGVLQALMRHDLKVLLAYHTVENIGIIATGLGLAIVLRGHDHGALAAVALSAALFHVLNHGLFKSLLFLGAGAVRVATGTRDMEALGGLIHRMPRTALLFLVGAAAISALPPFNGFASEWLTFQAIINAPTLPAWPLKFGLPLVGAALALAAALAACCFVKAFGIVFLGRARSDGARAAREVEAPMLAAMAALAGLCVALGALPTMALALLDPVTRALLGEGGAAEHGWFVLAPLGEAGARYGAAMLLGLLVAIIVATVVIVFRQSGSALRDGPAWDGGFPEPSARAQYTAASFAAPVRRVFGPALFAARESVDMPAPGETRAARFSLAMSDPSWRFLFTPVERGLAAASRRADGFQFLTIRRYLAVVVATLIALLVIVSAVS